MTNQARRTCRSGLLRLALAMALAGCATPEEVAPVESAGAPDEAPAVAPDDGPTEAPAPADEVPDDAPPAVSVGFGGEPTVLGAMGRDAFVGTVEAHFPTLSRCARSTVPNPDVIVKLTIAKDGLVSGATMRMSSGSPSVDRCIEKAFMSLRFPATGTGLVVAAVPLHLAPLP